jgi:rRNA-processing protein FCF1
LSRKATASVLIDTNFLFIPARFGVDIFEGIEGLLEVPARLIVTTSVIEELRGLGLDEKPSRSREAAFALTLSGRCEVLPLAPGETVDDSLVRVAKENGFYVATADAQLRRRCREEGVPVIFLRQRSHLALDGLKP